MSIRPSVMVVDDEEELANLFRTFPERSGFDSVSFTDPQSVPDHFRQNREKYSAVKTDWKQVFRDAVISHIVEKPFKLKMLKPELNSPDIICPRPYL